MSSVSTIRVIATATAVTAVEPATAVVSLVNPADLTSIRSSFCNQVHYFASPEDAQPWLAQHPCGELLPVGEASRLAGGPDRHDARPPPPRLRASGMWTQSGTLAATGFIASSRTPQA